MHRQWIDIFLASRLAACGLAFLVMGHGQWFNLPLVAQRTISWLPGDWDPELQGIRGGSDEWRAELRYTALQVIKRDPFLGRGFAIDISETITAIGMGERGGEIDIQVAAYALGRAWHNTWLGYAADFGIPLSVIQAIIYLSILVLSAKCFNFYGSRNLLGVFAMYILIFTVRDLAASNTSGHTALDAFARWWMYGLVVAIYYQMRPEKVAHGTASTKRFASLRGGMPHPAPGATPSIASLRKG